MWVDSWYEVHHVPKIANELEPLQAAQRASVIGLRFVGGVHGLALQVENVGTKNWMVR